MHLNPKQIVDELNKYIIGQHNAKKAVAIALRNRWRRQQVKEPLRSEITPKNILMIGPTGVGKTEIARRLAKMSDAPFIKVEATKFTEVGYVGRDVDSIIRDLIEIAIKETRDNTRKIHVEKAKNAVEERILDILLPAPRVNNETMLEADNKNNTREHFRNMLKNNELDDKEIEIEIALPKAQIELMPPNGFEEIANQLQGIFNAGIEAKKTKRKLKIHEAKKILLEEEANKLVNDDEVRLLSIKNVEQNGIVFIDEIDKVAIRGDNKGQDVSRS
ncbi:MAG TPA: AAA family ATPase, partial [Burkholderiales bacterium]|nr:AAA family ATPase [Burkholderiales bacterium]